MLIFNKKILLLVYKNPFRKFKYAANPTKKWRMIGVVYKILNEFTNTNPIMNNKLCVNSF